MEIGAQRPGWRGRGGQLMPDQSAISNSICVCLRLRRSFVQYIISCAQFMLRCSAKLVYGQRSGLMRTSPVCIFVTRFCIDNEFCNICVSKHLDEITGYCFLGVGKFFDLQSLVEWFFFRSQGMLSTKVKSISSVS